MSGKLPDPVQTCLGSHHRHIQVGRDLSRELVRPPAQGRVNTTQMKLLRTLISSVLKTYSNQDSTVSPSNYLHGLNYPHREFSVYPIGTSHVSIYKHPVDPLCTSVRTWLCLLRNSLWILGGSALVPQIYLLFGLKKSWSLDLFLTTLVAFH